MATYENVGHALLIGNTYWTTGWGSYDATYSPDGIIYCDGDGTASMRVKAATTEAWFRTSLYLDSINTLGSADDYPISVYDVNGVLLFGIKALDGGTVHYIYYRNSGANAAGPTIVFPAGGRTTIDIRVVTGVGTGLVELYKDETLFWSATGLDNGSANIGKCDCRTSNWSYNHAYIKYGYSEMLTGIGNSPTLGRRVFSGFPTADSAVNTAWSGTFADVDDKGATGDGNFAYTSTAGQRQGFTIPSLPTPNSDIEAVSIYTIDFIGSGSPRNLQHSIRLGGVDYDQGSVGSSNVIQSHETVIATNPATTNPWTISDLTGAEFGFIST